MARFGLVVGALLSMLLLGACGDDEATRPQSEESVYQESFELHSAGPLPQGDWTIREEGLGKLQQLISDKHAADGKQSLQLVGGPKDAAVVERTLGDVHESFYLKASVMLTEGAGAKLSLVTPELSADGAKGPLKVSVELTGAGSINVFIGDRVWYPGKKINISPMFWLGLKLKVWLLLDLFGPQLELDGEEIPLKLREEDDGPTTLEPMRKGVRLRLSASGNGKRAYFDKLDFGALR